MVTALTMDSDHSGFVIVFFTGLLLVLGGIISGMIGIGKDDTDHDDTGAMSPPFSSLPFVTATGRHYTFSLVVSGEEGPCPAVCLHGRCNGPPPSSFPRPFGWFIWSGFGSTDRAMSRGNKSSTVIAKVANTPGRV